MIKDELINFLDLKKKEIIEGKFFPTKTNIINENEEFANFKRLNNIVYKWFKNNTPFNSLSQLKVHFQGKSSTAKLYEFLDSRKNNILAGIFIPTKDNIIAERDEFKTFKEINNRIAIWLKKNTPFTGLRNLTEHFEGIPQVKKVRNFLNSKKKDILRGKFIPKARNIINLMPELETYKDLHVIVYNWINENTPFKSLTDLKEHFHIDTLAKELKEFLDSKKEQILNGEFIPDTKRIVSIKPEFKDYGTLNLIVAEWLSECSQFKKVTDIKQYYLGDSILTQIKNFLDLKYNDILNGKYIPTKNNLRKDNNVFGDYNKTNDVINRWLVENSEFKNLSELIDHFNPSRYDLRPETIKDKIWKFLDQRQEDIFSGEFFPTTKNLRIIDATIGNYEYLSKTVSKWINEKSNDKFDNLDDLIKYFNPYPNSLGHSGRHGYTANFESEYFRVKNAYDQTVKLTENNILIFNNFKKSIITWRVFFRNLKKNNDWMFVDLLTGEIFSKRDILDGKFSFHHIDSDKNNDDNDKLCFLLPHNHGIITVAQIYHPRLASFFENILTLNIMLIKSGIIPHSWKVGCRKLAIKEGINLPRRKYKMKIKNQTIIKQALSKRDLNNWL